MTDERRTGTIDEIARLVGRSRTAVFNKIQRAELEPVDRRGKAGLYDVESVVDLILQGQEQDLNQGSSPLRDRKIALEIEILEIKRRQMLGELVEAAGVETRYFKVFRALREAIMVVAEDLADELAAESRPDLCQAILAEALRTALESSSHVEDKGEPDAG